MIILVLSSLFILFIILFVMIWHLFFILDAKIYERIVKTCKKSIELGHYKHTKDLLWILSRKSKGIEVKYQLGVSQLELKDYKKARATFETILKIDSKNEKTLTRLAEVERAENRFDEALKYYLQSIKINVKNIENFIGIAEIYFENKEYAKSLEVYQKAAELDPDNTNITLNILKCKTELCDVEGEIKCTSVIEEYERLNEFAEKEPSFRKELARVYAKNGNMEQAEKCCERILNDFPDDIESLRMMGLLMLLRQDYVKAKMYITKAFSIDPKNIETHNILSYVVCQQVDNTPIRVCRLEYYNLVKEYLKDNDNV